MKRGKTGEDNKTYPVDRGVGADAENALRSEIIGCANEGLLGRRIGLRSAGRRPFWRWRRRHGRPRGSERVDGGRDLLVRGVLAVGAAVAARGVEGEAVVDGDATEVGGGGLAEGVGRCGRGR